MAIAMRTFGSTLSDLQALTNADKGLDYQRANAQDAINAQRLEAFLRLRGQALQTEAQKNRDAADRAQRMAELIQQGSQFKTSEENLMKRAQMDAETRREVAKTTAEGRGLDPRFYQNFSQIQALNQEKQQRHDYLNQLSETRKQLERQKKTMMDNRSWYDRGVPGFLGASTEWTELENKLKQLDAQAAAQVDPDTGIGPVIDPETGGYIIPPFRPIPLPDLGRSTVPAQGGVPPASIPVEPVLPFAGGAFRGTGGGASWDVPVPVSPVPRRVLRFDPGTMDFVP